jgi:hypothetical protein
VASSKRKNIPAPVTNRLFALSGNQCAFPGCTNTVTDQVLPGEQPVTLAQRAHIVGVGRQGPRSRAILLSANVDAMENPMLPCGKCHLIVDRHPRIYSVEVLAKFKTDREARMAPKDLRPAAQPLDVDRRSSVGYCLRSPDAGRSRQCRIPHPSQSGINKVQRISDWQA